MKAVIIMSEHLQMCEMLDDAEKAELLNSLIDHVNGREPAIQSKSVKILFNIMLNVISENERRYTEKCERNKDNAKKRWLMRTDATACDRMRPNANECINQDLNLNLNLKQNQIQNQINNNNKEEDFVLTSQNFTLTEKKSDLDFDKEKKEKSCGKKEKNPLHTGIISIYDDWYKATFKHKPIINGADGKAVTSIITALTEVDSGIGQEYILQSFKTILNRFSDWDKFHQKNIRLYQIAANLPNIIVSIKKKCNSNDYLTNLII